MTVFLFFSYVVGHGVVVLVYVLRSHFSIMASIFCDFEVLTSAMPDYRWALDNALPGKTSEEKTATWKQVLTCLAYALKREGMKGHKGIENQLILKRFSAWLQGMQPESHGFAMSSKEDHLLVEVCMTPQDLQGWVQVCQNAVDISKMLAACAKHLEELCELLRGMCKDRETYWCAEAVGLLKATLAEWTTRRENIAGLPTGKRPTA